MILHYGKKALQLARMAMPHFASLRYFDRGRKRVDHTRNLSALTLGQLSRSHRPNAPMSVGLIMSLYSTRVAGTTKNFSCRIQFRIRIVCTVLLHTVLRPKGPVVIA